ncbi:MAG: hypothetical protein ACRC2R_10875 [Xenococcaceae cyanobacterium]
MTSFNYWVHSIDRLLAGKENIEPQLLREIAEDKSVSPHLRYLAASCWKLTTDAEKQQSYELEQREWQ